MDRNQVIGFALIAVLMSGYFFWVGMNEPAPNPQVAQAQVDSLQKKAEKKDPIAVAKGTKLQLDSNYKERNPELNNGTLRVRFSSIGAIPQEAELLKEKTWDQKPLVLFNQNNNSFKLIGFNKGQRTDLYEWPYQVEFESKDSLSFIAKDSSGAVVVRQSYAIAKVGYQMRYHLETPGFAGQQLQYSWTTNIPKVEMDTKQSQEKSTVNYYSDSEGLNDLTETSHDKEEETATTTLNWVSLKQKFFNTGIVAETPFKGGSFKSWINEQDTTGIKNLEANMSLAEIPKQNFTYYFGTNHFKSCKAVTEGYHKNVNLGWPVINWINRFVVIPVFNLLEQYIDNYGIIIIILVLLIRIVMFPLNWKSYLAMAKMKVMKPELDAIKEKHPEDLQKAQMEQMTLYRSVGINPLAGCVPLLLQMPILLAMFSFFPASIELRQEAFLWAPDLSTYDNPILLGFEIPFYGSHISIFTLLMTLSTIAYTYYNNQMTTATTPAMKIMSYTMPVVFMFMLNSFPAGLSFYYFISNISSIGQQLIIKQFVDEGAIRAKLDENRVKNEQSGGAKKSKWSERMEEAMRLQREQEKLKKNKSTKK
jgi:YidC/Oxa1 family membrane protein insertase